MRARLFLLILAAMLPAFIVIAWNAVNARDQAMLAAEREAQNIVRLARQHERKTIDTTRQILANLSSLPIVRKPAEHGDCSRKLAELLVLHPVYTNFGVASLDGNVYCSALPFDQPQTIEDRSYFLRAVESGDFSVGDFQVGRITGVPAINFGYPLLNDAGEAIGVVYAAMNLSTFQELIHGLTLPMGSSMSIIDAGGTVLAHSALGSTVTGQAQQDRPLIQAVISSRQEGIREFAGLDGEERIYAFAPVMMANAGNVYIAVGIPKSSVLAAANRALVSGMSIMFAAFAAVSLIAWFGTEVLLARKLRTLAEASRQLARGRLEVRSGLRHGSDEIGQLAMNFDNMARELQQSSRGLQTLSAVNKVLVRADNERELLQTMCDIAVEIGNYNFAWVGFISKEDNRIIEVVAQAGYPGGIEAFRKATGRITLEDGPLGGSLVARSIRSGREFIVQDLESDPGVTPWRAIMRSEGSGSAAAFPLSVGHEIIGAISIHARRVNAFNENQVRLLRETAGDLGFGIGILRASAEHARVRELMDRLAYQDDVTGLPNYGGLTRELAERLRHGKDESIGVILLNLNRFGEVNDALGNIQGDNLLRNIGAILQDNAGESEFVARMRGDEFAVLVPGLKVDDADRTADRIQAGLPATVDLDGIAIDLNTTAGVAVAPDHSLEVSSLIHCADTALRNARRTGSRHAIYSSELHTTSPESLALAGDLRTASAAGQLELYYQPKCRFIDNGLAGVEALVRWKHPHHGQISPAEFIPLAERTGQIKEITEFVLEEALRQTAQWRSEGFDVAVAVNVSSRNLHEKTLLGFIEGLLEKYHVPQGGLELELTESAIMENVRAVRELLHNLRGLGVTLSIDDFGTGYSSLRYLQQLPVHNLKIDKSFVMQMLDDHDSEAIVASTIRMAHDLGLRVIAEGVETRAAWNRLAELHCDTGQGYLLARPAPASEFLAWVEKKGKTKAS